MELDVISKVVELKSMTADYVANREHVRDEEEWAENRGDHLWREEQSRIWLSIQRKKLMQFTLC